MDFTDFGDVMVEVVRVEEVVAASSSLASHIRVVEINDLGKRKQIGVVYVLDTPAGRAEARIQLDDMLRLPLVESAPGFMGEAELVVFQDVEDARSPARPGAPARTVGVPAP